MRNTLLYWKTLENSLYFFFRKIINERENFSNPQYGDVLHQQTLLVDQRKVQVILVFVGNVLGESLVGGLFLDQFVGHFDCLLVGLSVGRSG